MTASMADEFAQLRRHPRFEEALAGPPPRRPGATSSRRAQVMGAGIALVVFTPVALLSVLALVLLAATPDRPMLDRTIVAFSVVAGGSATAVILAWRSLSEMRAPRPDRAAYRTAARIVRVDRRGQQRVDLEHGDGARGSYPVGDGLVATLSVGELGVASLLDGRLVEFDRLIPAVPSPRRAT